MCVCHVCAHSHAPTHVLAILLLLLSGTHQLSWQHSLCVLLSSQCTMYYGVNGEVQGTCCSMCFCCELLFGLYPIQVILAREAKCLPQLMLDLNKEAGIALP